MAVLELHSGLNPGQLFPLEGDSAILGRHPDCDVVLDVGAVSRQHAKVVRVNGKYLVEDLNSRNGTYVNGQLIQGRTPLSDKDRLQVCDLEFTFHEQSPISSGRGSNTVSDLNLQTLPETLVERRRSATLVDDDQHNPSTIMSKIEVSVADSGLRVEIRPETKLKAIFEIVRNLRRTLALEEVLPKILQSLFTVFVQADRGFIILRENGRLIPKAIHQRRESDDNFRISRTIVNTVMDTREAVLSADAASDQRFDMSQSIADFQIRSMMCAPLLDSEGNAMGVIQIDAVSSRGRFTQDDLEVLVSVADQAAFAVENAQWHERAMRQQAIERDLQLAHEVQRGLLPFKRPHVPGYQFYDYYEPANEVGGDYYGYVELEGGRQGVILADVSGKGVAAALLVAKLSADVKHCLLREPSAAKALTEVGMNFDAAHLEGRFVTMVLLVLDPATGEVNLSNAGHMAPLLRHVDGTVEPVGDDEAGVPIGVISDYQYEETKLTLAPGESLTAYTDGISEAMNDAGEQYSIERMEKILAEAPVGADASKLGQDLLEDVRKHVDGTAQFDDMCVVIVAKDR